MPDELFTLGECLPGDAFIAYVRKVLFPGEKYDLIRKNGDRLLLNGGAPENGENPDLRLRALREGEEFYVEANYIPEFRGGALECCPSYQLERFRRLNATTPVFIVVGVGGRPEAPGQVFLVPVHKMIHSKLYRSILAEYEIDAHHGVDDRILAHLVS
jgi:hypothetical protein